MKRSILCATIYVVLTAASANAETMSAFDWGNVPPGEAWAFYDRYTGELFFDVGEDVVVIGIFFDGIYSDQVDSTSIFGAPAQNDGTILAYFSGNGLPVGTDSLGFVLPVGMCATDLQDVDFVYTPLPTVGATRYERLQPLYSCLPEPSTFALLATSVLGLFCYGWRRWRLR